MMLLILIEKFSTVHKLVRIHFTACNAYRDIALWAFNERQSILSAMLVSKKYIVAMVVSCCIVGCMNSHRPIILWSVDQTLKLPLACSGMGLDMQD